MPCEQLGVDVSHSARGLRNAEIGVYELSSCLCITKPQFRLGSERGQVVGQFGDVAGVKQETLGGMGNQFGVSPNS